jgi:precorrin-3B C17-methyltransferase
MKAIEEAEIIVGYKTYLDLVRGLIKEKEVMSSGMRQEVERCAKAVELAGEGKKVAVICSGDPGIYAMAGLVFVVLRAKDIEMNVEVIPGIAALNASASRLGAPLMHDFASISLSDLLTPWEMIEKRLEAAASADFVIVIYNPKSKGRPEHIMKARDIILKHRPAQTPVGIVRAATRDEEEIIITDLGNLPGHKIDMQSTVIIGNSMTFIWKGKMVTPRGYGSKYKI